MIKSMTGFGHINIIKDAMNIDIEVKSINSKNLDISINSPKPLNCNEIKWKRMISKHMLRGKISLYVSIYYDNLEESFTLKNLSKTLFKNNYKILKSLSEEIQEIPKNLFELSLHYSLANLKKENNDILKEDNIEFIEKQIEKAIIKCDETRITEGKYLESKILEYLKHIEKNFLDIKKNSKNRLPNIKNRITEKLNTYFEDKFDKNRFEQELLYYSEKLDIEEEIVRLDKHLKNFLKTLKSSNFDVGKKLIFITQEILRETNTLGAKCSELEIQNNVISIKENIEKIKEQLYNIV